MDLDPKAPYIFGPPGSGTVIIFTGSFLDDANVISKSNKQKHFGKKYYFNWHPATEKSRIRIHKSVVQILDPDPYRNFKDPQHCLKRGCFLTETVTSSNDTDE